MNRHHLLQAPYPNAQATLRPHAETRFNAHSCLSSGALAGCNEQPPSVLVDGEENAVDTAEKQFKRCSPDTSKAPGKLYQIAGQLRTLSVRKISASRRSDFKRPRRAIPPQNARKRELYELLERENALVDALVRDDKIRSSIERGLGLAPSPMSVWSEIDHSYRFTEVEPWHLPAWEDLTEFMKLFVAYDAGREFESAYSFTSHIAPTILERWARRNAAFMPNVTQRLRRQLQACGIGSIPYCLIAETRTRSNRSDTRPHLHGFVLVNEPLQATRLNVALEKAFYPGLKKNGRFNPIKVERSYDRNQTLGSGLIAVASR